MRRGPRLLCAIAAILAVLAVGLGGPAIAAFEIVVAVSPVEVVAGRPVDVLVRTFVPVGRDQLSLPESTLAYPAPSGLSNVLYPIGDYPFDVVAEAVEGTSKVVSLSRSIDDATLWRGTFTPDAVGTWTVTVRNFPRGQAGTSAQVRVVAGDAVPVPVLAAGGGLLVGVLIALAVASFRRNQRR